MLIDHTDLRLEIEKIKKKLESHDKNIEVVFRYLDELVTQKDTVAPRTSIGYKINEPK